MLSRLTGATETLLRCCRGISTLTMLRSSCCPRRKKLPEPRKSPLAWGRGFRGGKSLSLGLRCCRDSRSTRDRLLEYGIASTSISVGRAPLQEIRLAAGDRRWRSANLTRPGPANLLGLLWAGSLFGVLVRSVPSADRRFWSIGFFRRTKTERLGGHDLADH